MVKQYKKKPVIIEAVQWCNNLDEMYQFLDQENNPGIVGLKPGNPDALQIRTIEGVMTAQKNDMIIKGVQGEFYPCKLEIFEKTYEAV